jgi:tRNA-specific 2-thiouridylase
VPASCAPDGQGLLIEPDLPVRGVARGQAAVLYDGDLVLGSATVTSAIPAGQLAGSR